MLGGAGTYCDDTADEGLGSASSEVEILWARFNRCVWAWAHAFEKKLYLICDLVATNFVPTDLKLPKPA